MEDIRKRIETALETIRPYLQSDGGDVRIHEILPDYTVQLELVGACGSCSMSHMTMKAGIEQAIRKAVPEVTAVSTINPIPNV